jgi:hypothetical protein
LAANEPVNEALKNFYARLLDVLRQPVVHNGEWQLLECAPAWDGNGSSDALIAFAWHDARDARLLVAVNYAAHPSQCYVRLPFSGLANRRWRLRDLLGDAVYERDGNDLESRGLYLDVPPWRCHVFELETGW